MDGRLVRAPSAWHTGPMPAVRRLLLAALAVAGVLTSAPGGHAAVDPIQPGDYHETDAGGCTLNFAYDGAGNLAGRVYLGTAGHCVTEVGEDVRLLDGTVFGDVALVGDPDKHTEDYAFIEVRPEYRDRVSAAVKGWPQYPSAVGRWEDSVTLDTLQLSGYGLGFDLIGPTRENRSGGLTYHDADELAMIAPAIFGDSGGPIVREFDGAALGIVSRLCQGRICTEIGPTIESVMAQAASRGFPVTLRTV